MGTEQFCLRWNDFHSNITAAFSEIRDEDDFFDVTLVGLQVVYNYCIILDVQVFEKYFRWRVQNFLSGCGG